MVMVVPLILGAAGCSRSGGDRAGAYDAHGRSDCLPAITLTDQNGTKVSLASLKGKPVLVDFVYTSCSGPCPMLTAKFAATARRLGSELGRQVTMVTITLDPEHDTPQALKEYARQQGADRPGWLFLTGTPGQIEQVLAAFNLRRERESDGSVTHELVTFLLGPDGRERRQYDGLRVKSDTLAAEATALAKGTEAARQGTTG